MQRQLWLCLVSFSVFNQFFEAVKNVVDNQVDKDVGVIMQSDHQHR